MNIEKFLAEFLKAFAGYIAADLANVAHQEKQTTKHVRRQKALSYLFEELSGELDHWGRLPADVSQWLEATEYLKACCKSPEAITGFERTEHRLRHHLDRLAAAPIRGAIRCVGCNEWRDPSGPHECINKSAKAKDQAMTRDDTVQETT